MFIKRRFFIFIVFSLLVFALLTYQAVSGEIDKRYFSFLNYPVDALEQGIAFVKNGVRDLFGSIAGIRDNRPQLANNCETAQDKVRYEEILRENERLLALLELRSKRPDFIATAEVFARDPTNWFQTFWINKGTENGISGDMIAVTPSGVAGKIFRVFGDRASIIQITDINSAVAARVQSSRTEGILEGNGDNRCYLKYVPVNAEVSKGDAVITSGLDGIFPEGLLAGYVSGVEKKEGDLFQTVEVTPVQDFKTVEEVAILGR